MLAEIIERVLGFPKDAYFAQRGKDGLKPDFTPMDVIAHPFVFDAKGSDQSFAGHEEQIRRYMRQRSLDYGILFNLHEFRVYGRSPARGHDRTLSFALLPLWREARGEAIPIGEHEAFERFCDTFGHRAMGTTEQIQHVRDLPPWASRIAQGDPVEVDVEFLVQQLRVLSVRLADDAGAQRDALEDFLRLNPSRRSKILEELRVLANDISPGTDLAGLPQAVEGWIGADGLAGRAWRQYLVRVAYLALTRILLYRAWEDVDFADSYLYDGGFNDAFDRLSQNVRRVLDEAFMHGAELYRWIYGEESNYEWFRPREPALVETLYRLSPFPLGKLDADVLGGLYQTYVEEIDRDRLGQFFTPRSVVRFMLDRAGFTGPEGVFELEGDTRKSKRVLDFATGSGGFLVEAARRVIDEAGIDLDDPRAIKEALAAISTGFYGAEISPFPYYLSEINLLLQVSRLLGRLRVAGERPQTFTLGILHADTLETRGMSAASLEQLDAEHRGDRTRLVGDDSWDLGSPLSGAKQDRYRDLRLGDGSFDLVMGNPPYVPESDNMPLFRRLQSIHSWDGTYRGKTDYLYYFVILALEKVAPGGRMCVITPASWMNAGAADFLRARLASELRLDELFLFGSYKLFAPEHGIAPTPLVESAILIATRTPLPRGHKLRVVVLEDEALAGNPSREELLEEMARRVHGKQGRRAGIHVHHVLQRDLRPEYPWPIKHSVKDLPARVVAHLERCLGEGGACEPLATSWKTFLGIQTGADSYSNKIRNNLSPEARARLDALGAQIGEPVFGLPPKAEATSPWLENRRSLVQSPEPEAVLYGAIDDDDYVNLVWLTRANPPSSDVLKVIERWRPLLAERAEFKRNPRRQWWETCWPRDRKDLQAPKVIALHRTDRGRFSLDEQGRWSPSGRMSVVVGRESDAPVAYLCGLLNSELLDLWYGIRGRVPRDIWRDYEPKPMNAIPYRRPEDDGRSDEIANLVRQIATNRRDLLPHRPVVRDLGRIVKDPWKDGPVVLDRAELVAELPQKEKVSVRLDPELSLTGSGSRGKPARNGKMVLLLRRGKAEVARVEGDTARLDLLEELLGDRVVDDLGAVLLPKNIDAFERLAAARAELVTGLLAEGRKLVERVERLVCGLYEVPDELTEEVVTHALGRAQRAA